MEITFRRAEPDEMETIIRFHIALNEHDGTETDPVRTRTALQMLMSREEWGGVWLLCADGRPVGYIVLTWGFSLEFGGRDAFVDELYIEASHRGKGLGRQALALAESICQTQNIQALHLEVDRENHPAQAFYDQVGFEKRANYFLMSKRLER